MKPCPACKATFDEPEPENSFGWYWDSYQPSSPKPMHKYQYRRQQKNSSCGVCGGSGDIHDFALGVRNEYYD